MPKPRAKPRVRQWNGDWFLFYRENGGYGSERRIKCSEHGYTSAAARRRMVKEFCEKEEQERAEMRLRGAGVAYDTPLIKALEAYLSSITAREEARRLNPEGREGLTTESARQVRFTIEDFIQWLKKIGKANLTTGGMDAPTLQDYFQKLASEDAVRGEAKVKRSVSTLNKHKRHVKGALNHLNERRPRLFPDFDIFKKPLRQVSGEMQDPRAFGHQELSKFLGKAIEHEVNAIQRLYQNVEPENRARRGRTSAETPVSLVFVLLALTGVRQSEALNLKWESIDPYRGILRFRRTKTGPLRVLQLRSAPEAVIAPKLADLLTVLYQLAKRSPSRANGYVLPHGSRLTPYFPRKKWERIDTEAGLFRITPQALRQNFCSYCASMNVDSAVAAMWSGHKPAVAERYYRTLVPARLFSQSFEAAMGLETGIDRLIDILGKAHGVWPPGSR